jgi:hypothetical protein
VPRDPEKHSPAWGGRRSNQTGRPRKADKKIRIGALFLPPEYAAWLALAAEDGESLIEAARRILISVAGSQSGREAPLDERHEGARSPGADSQ